MKTFIGIVLAALILFFGIYVGTNKDKIFTHERTVESTFLGYELRNADGEIVEATGIYAKD